jgi:hypothetical protein
MMYLGMVLVMITLEIGTGVFLDDHATQQVRPQSPSPLHQGEWHSIDCTA